MNKKAQGLSLNTIVIAAIVLIILLVLVGIFTGYFGNFAPALKGAGERTCDIEGFTPRPELQGCADNEQRVYGNFKKGTLDPGQVCCKLVSGDCSDDFDGVCLESCTPGVNIEISRGTASCPGPIAKTCCTRA